jgi:Ca2+-transporting ATPase
LASALISVLIGQWDDAISIFLAVVIVSTVGFVQEYQSEQSMQALNQHVAQKALVVRDNREEEILAENLVVGDVIILARGFKVPADVRLFQSADLRIEEAILTGEAHAVKKHTNIINADHIDIADQKNMAFMGTMGSFFNYFLFFVRFVRYLFYLFIILVV